MRAQRIELLLLGMDRDLLQRVSFQHIEQISQAYDMVQMSVCEKDVERVGRQVIAHPIHGRPSIEDDPQLGYHQAGCMPAIVGMVAGCAQ